MLEEMQIAGSGGSSVEYKLDDIPRDKMQTDTGGAVGTDVGWSASGYILIDNSDLSFIPTYIGTGNIYQYNTDYTVVLEGTNDDGTTYTQLASTAFSSGRKNEQYITPSASGSVLYKKYRVSFTKTAGSGIYLYSNFFKGIFI